MPKHSVRNHKKSSTKSIPARPGESRQKSPSATTMGRIDDPVPMTSTDTLVYLEPQPSAINMSFPKSRRTALLAAKNIITRPEKSSTSPVHSQLKKPTESLPLTTSPTTVKPKEISQPAIEAAFPTGRLAPSLASEMSIAEPGESSPSESSPTMKVAHTSAARTTVMNQNKPLSTATTNISTKRAVSPLSVAQTTVVEPNKPLSLANIASEVPAEPRASVTETMATSPSEIASSMTTLITTKSKPLPLLSAETAMFESQEPPTSRFTSPSRGRDVEPTSSLTESPVQSLFIFGHGGFQRVVLAFACVAAFVSYTQSFLLVAESLPVKHWCKADQRRVSSLVEFSAGRINVSAPSYSNESLGQCTRPDPSLIASTGSPRQVPCNRWEYDKSKSKSSIVAEWDLVCQRKRLKQLIWVCFMIGGAAAVPTLGLTADIVGRRPVLIGALILLLLSGTGACLSKSLAGFTALRFVSAASSGALDVTSTVLLFESTPSGPRASFVAASVSLATAISPLFAIAVKEMSSTWRMLHALLLVPALLLTFLVCAIEESPHWCLYNNKFDDAERVILWAARLNLEDPDLVRDRLDRIRKDVESRGGGTFRSARLLRCITSLHMCSRCFALFGCWFFVYIAYYARDYENLPPWGPDSHAQLQAAVWFVVTGNFPAMAVAYGLTRRHGGLRSLFSLLAACSMMSALQSALVAAGGRLSLLLVYCSSVIILNVAYVALVVHTVDAFPTPVRSLGYSGAFMSGRIGAMMGALFREFESMPLPTSLIPTAVTSLGLLAFAVYIVLAPPTPTELIADEGSPVVRDKSGEVISSEGSPMSWRVHKRQSPTESVHSEYK